MYYNDYLKTISINLEEFLIDEQGSRIKGAGFKKITHDYHKKRKTLMNSVEIALKLGYPDRFR